MSPPPKDFTRSKYANYEEWYAAKLNSARITYEKNKAKYNKQQMDKYHAEHPGAIHHNIPRLVKTKEKKPAGRPKGTPTIKKPDITYGRPPGQPTVKKEGIIYGRPKGQPGKNKYTKNPNIAHGRPPGKPTRPRVITPGVLIGRPKKLRNNIVDGGPANQESKENPISTR